MKVAHAKIVSVVHAMIRGETVKKISCQYFSRRVEVQKIKMPREDIIMRMVVKITQKKHVTRVRRAISSWVYEAEVVKETKP